MVYTGRFRDDFSLRVVWALEWSDSIYGLTPGSYLSPGHSQSTDLQLGANLGWKGSHRHDYDHPRRGGMSGANSPCSAPGFPAPGQACD